MFSNTKSIDRLQSLTPHATSIPLKDKYQEYFEALEQKRRPSTQHGVFSSNGNPQGALSRAQAAR